MSRQAYESAPLADKHHFFTCGDCGEEIDARDLDEVLQHETHTPQPDVPYSHSIKMAPSGEFAHLAHILPGEYRCRKWYQLTRRKGWLEVERKERLTSIRWTSDREAHHPYYGPATIVEVDADGNLTAYYEAARALHLKWGYGRGDEAWYQKGLAEARWMATVLRDTIPVVD